MHISRPSIILIAALLIVYSSSPPAQTGSAQADFEAGVALYKEGRTRDAIERFQRAAAEQHGKAMSTLGIIAWNKEDYAVAHEWLLKAAERGERMAHHVLAIMHWNGQGVQQDPLKATEHMHIAADSGAELVLANSMKEAYECTNKLPGVSPALSGRGGVVFRNEGGCIRLRYNPNAVYIEGLR